MTPEQLGWWIGMSVGTLGTLGVALKRGRSPWYASYGLLFGIWALVFSWFFLKKADK
jgi:hypothetical protein